MRPSGLEAWKARIDRTRLVELLAGYHRGEGKRIKLRDLAVVLCGPAIEADSNQSFANRALGEVIAELVEEGNAIGSLDGGEGGVYWCATEGERAANVYRLEQKERAYHKRAAALRRASLDPMGPRQQAIF